MVYKPTCNWCGTTLQRLFQWNCAPTAPAAPGLLFGPAGGNSSDLYRDMDHPVDLDGRTGQPCRGDGMMSPPRPFWYMNSLLWKVNDPFPLLHQFAGGYLLWNIQE